MKSAKNQIRTRLFNLHNFTKNEKGEYHKCAKRFTYSQSTIKIERKFSRERFNKFFVSYDNGSDGFCFRYTTSSRNLYA